MVKVTFGYSSTRSPTRSPNSPLSCDSNLRLYPCPDPQSLFLCIDNFVSSANLTPMKENLQTLANTFFNNAATYDDDFLYLSGRGVYKFGGNSKTTTSAVLDATLRFPAISSTRPAGTRTVISVAPASPTKLTSHANFCTPAWVSSRTPASHTEPCTTAPPGRGSCGMETQGPSRHRYSDG